MKRALQMLALVVASTAMLSGAAAAQQQTAPDNTKRNKAEATTADQQKNNKADVETTRRIRKSIVDDKALSTYAHNIKIVTEDGQVTLTGPVNTPQEQAAVAAKAVRDRRLGQGAQSDGSGAFQDIREIVCTLFGQEVRMAGKNTSVLGIYSNYSTVERAVDTLKDEGFRNTDISVLFPANVGTKDFAHEKGTKAPEGATTGGGTGAVVGGALGWLAGIGALAIPGSGRSSPPVRSWRRWRAARSAAPSAGLPAR